MTAPNPSEAPELYGRYDGFRAPEPRDELLHPSTTDDILLSETSYLGCSVPEAGIDVQIYHWFHPNLGTTSGGIVIWRGHCPQIAEAEYVDYRNFTRFPDGDLDEITYPTGVHVEVLDPLRQLKIDFRSPDGRVVLDMLTTGIMPPAGRPDGQHFVQAMHCAGTLFLDGQTHEIDSWFTRDRSYGTLRPEVAQPIPPAFWGSAVFGLDLALHHVGHDSVDLTAESLRWGYVYEDDELHEVVRVRQSTHRAADGIRPVGVAVELEDRRGKVFRMIGEMATSLPMSFWPNMVTHIHRVRWTLEDGRVGHGNCMETVYSDFLRSARSVAAGEVAR